MSGWPCLTASPPCTCQCHKVSAARRDRASQPGRRWTLEQDAALHDYLRQGLPTPTIATALNARFKTERTARAVQCRVTDLGASTREAWLSRSDVQAYFTVNHRTISRWMATGVLPAARHTNRFGRQSRWWSIKPDDLMAFVERYVGELFDVRSVIEPALRRRAEVAARARARRSA